jgi:hypothetical protein
VGVFAKTFSFQFKRSFNNLALIIMHTYMYNNNKCGHLDSRVFSTTKRREWISVICVKIYPWEKFAPRGEFKNGPQDQGCNVFLGKIGFIPKRG